MIEEIYFNRWTFWYIIWFISTDSRYVWHADADNIHINKTFTSLKKKICTFHLHLREVDWTDKEKKCKVGREREEFALMTIKNIIHGFWMQRKF